MKKKVAPAKGLERTDLPRVTVVELTAEWSRLWQAEHRRKLAPTSPLMCKAIVDEMRRRRKEYVRRAGGRIDRIPNPYEGFTNGLYEDFREGAAAFLIGIPEAEAMAHHGCFFREAYHAAQDYVLRGRAISRDICSVDYWNRPDGTPHLELLSPQLDLFEVAA